jgi:hypothetical protein
LHEFIGQLSSIDIKSIGESQVKIESKIQSKIQSQIQYEIKEKQFNPNRSMTNLILLSKPSQEKLQNDKRIEKPKLPILKGLNFH